MVDTIPHDGNEENVTASGGTLDTETTFYRDQATLTTDFTLTLPTDQGDMEFHKDPQDSISVDASDIESFLVGPIFHLPDETDGDNLIEELIEEHKIILLVTLIGEENDHFLHFFLD